MATNAAGCYERHDTAVKETTVTQAGGVSLKIAGNGSHEIRVPVDAVSTVISLYMYADTNYSTATPPQAVLLANGEINVGIQTLPMSPTTVNQWNPMSFAAFTPSAAGIVTIRLVGVPAATSGICYFDTFAVSGSSVGTGDMAYFNRGEPLSVVAGSVNIIQVQG